MYKKGGRIITDGLIFHLNSLSARSLKKRQDLNPTLNKYWINMEKVIPTAKEYAIYSDCNNTGTAMLQDDQTLEFSESGLTYGGSGEYDQFFSGANKKFAISCWFRPSAPGNAIRTLIGSINFVDSPSSVEEFQWWLRLEAFKVRFRWYTSNTVFATYDGSTTISTNVWYNVHINYDQTQSNVKKVDIYINGALESNTHADTGTPSSIQSSSACALQIANYFEDPTFEECSTTAFYGKLPIIRIYDRNLSLSEIKTNYNEEREMFK